MVDAFSRFPHTPHIAWLGDAAPRDDKVMTPVEVEELLSGAVVVEEKLDGANLGFSVGPDGLLMAQNRGSYLREPFPGQFSKLPTWTVLQEHALVDALGGDLIAFGEWCAARHSLDYDRLPDWWLLFDIYDRCEQRFWSTRRRDEWAAHAGITVVPVMQRGHMSFEHLRDCVLHERSVLRNGPLEGVVVRREDEEWLLARGKLVNPQFTQAIDEHWRGRRMEWNRLATSWHG